MSDFAKTIASAGDLSKKKQTQAGTPVSGAMDPKYQEFLAVLTDLLERGEIDPYEPQSFLKPDVYASLSDDWKEKADLALINLANQVRQIQTFLVSKDTPDESPQLETMVEQLWEMKQRIEEHHDVFKF